MSWPALCAVGVLLPCAPSRAAAQGGGGSAGTEWTGIVTVERRASGEFRAGDKAIGFEGSQTATFTLNGDGTASWHSSFSSTTDMGGLYTIPASGSGGGFGYGSVEFNGETWEIHAGAEDDLEIRVDYTDQDRVWATQGLGAMLVEMAKAMGQPIPSLSAHVEKESVGVPGATVPARAAPGATSLSGSISETVPGGADAMGGIGTIPATYTYTWRLTKGPARSHVRIYGPECGCLDADATDKALHFIAGASPAGGTFSEFIVSSDGAAPQVDANVGGEQPSLDITGTRDTGSVTLRIRYTRNGTTAESAPFIVDFCAIDRLELADGNEHDLAFDLDGRLVVEAKTKAWRGGKDVSAELQWEIEEMGSPTSLGAEPSEKKGERITFTYQNMPKRNADFGPKKLTARTTGRCACQQEETIRTFYPDIDSNHPDDGTPNWFYYWKQTSAVPSGARPMVEFREMVSDPNMPGRPIAKYDHQTQKILISDAAFGVKACRGEVDEGRMPTGRQAEGIDCFGETVRHELQHRADAVAWWGGPGGPYGVNLLEWFLKDWDHDQVPNTVEESRPDCQPGEWTNAPIDLAKVVAQQGELVERGRRTWFTCRERPFADASDAEIDAYRQGWTWPLGSANSEDWSCGNLSKQWQGKKCGP
ncbi:MAG: hypothetical protein IT176_09555 [Acidobacteria bacterium]|nr:hypothetical protein [Acidobacteriota bacterium]